MRLDMGVRRVTVYPRVCGGTLAFSLEMSGRQGLSPRVRGNLKSAVECPLAGWSIPACAGEPSGRPTR